MRARIQRQLCRLQRPDYIQSLEVVGVDCGSTAPSLCNWRALPQPGAAIWPQLLFDMRYQGEGHVRYRSVRKAQEKSSAAHGAARQHGTTCRSSAWCAVCLLLLLEARGECPDGCQTVPPSTCCKNGTAFSLNVRLLNLTPLLAFFHPTN